MKKGNPIALLPIGVFLLMYLGLGLTFEYGMQIPMGFYSVPIVGAFLVSICTACFQNRKTSFEEKLAIMGQGVGDKNIITMLLIFLAAGAFVGVVGRSSAQSVAYFMLSVIPPQFGVAVLFVVSCFISTAMGTSVGTITLLTPIAVEVATAAAFDPALCIATVVGGSMFGDNLSLISDTTIAACNGQGCAMKDKFRGNFRIALPAAVMSLVIILFLTAKDEEFDVVRGLDAGGNDYVSKPFRVQELLSRIRALLRRIAAPVVHATGFEIDQEKMQVRKDGEVLPLTLTEYRVLLMLIQRGSVVTRSSLLELLWDDGAKFVDDNTLSVHMSRLRDKVGAEHIRTVRGVGYQWVE